MRIKNRGFTLIELMITVAIVAILAAVAYPAYTRHVIKANRAAAQAQMMDIANRQQQFLLADRSYVASTDGRWTNTYSLPAEVGKRYSYTVEASGGTSTMPSFTITFTPFGAQESDGVLTLNHQGVKTPAEKW